MRGRLALTRRHPSLPACGEGRVGATSPLRGEMKRGCVVYVVNALAPLPIEVGLVAQVRQELYKAGLGALLRVRRAARYGSPSIVEPWSGERILRSSGDRTLAKGEDPVHECRRPRQWTM